MKRKLRIGEGYTLFRNNHKHLTIKYISLLVVLTIMCLETQGQAPARGVAAPAALGRDSITLLRVGDTIPEELWQLPLPHWNGHHTQATISLNDFRDMKLILLDFWASYCSSCLGGFPLLDSLQRVHHADLQVVLINPAPASDTPGHIVRAFSRNLSIPLNLPIVFPDTMVYRYFEIPGVPCYIWIDSDGVVQAITKRKAVTPEAIQTFISNQNR